MKVVRFSAYRQYEFTRVEASNAVMGLLAGAQMAAHLLRLTDGSDRLLPEIFPRVAHIGRFNLTTETARNILVSADAHLGAMAVPYTLAIHEDYLKTCLSLLERGGINLSQAADRIRLASQHEEIERATGGAFTSDSLQQVHTLRRMRNCTIHAGGRTDSSLINYLATWTPTAEAGWIRLANRSPRGLQAGSVVKFGHGELLVALASTKRLAREANQLLQPALPRPLWADLLVEDLVETNPGVLAGVNMMRRTLGHARFHYQPLSLTKSEVTEALSRAGYLAGP